MITLIFFLSLFVFETVAVLDGDWAIFFYSLLPALYFLEKDFKNQKIIPPSFLKIFFLFLFSTGVAFLKSVDKINSLDRFFLWLTAFFLSVVGMNERLLISFYFKKILISLSFLYAFFSLLPKEFFGPTAYQLVYPLYPNHNHLGDFLGLTLLFLFYCWLLKKEKKDLFLFFIFFPFFIFSFSRSSYFDFIFVSLGIISQYKNLVKKQSLLFFWGTIFLTGLFFIISLKEFYQLPLFNYLLPAVTKILNFQPRSLSANRPEYFSQAIKGFLERPFFGWGLGNFYYLSRKHVSENPQQVHSALNLPLTLLAEVGIFGFFLFLLFFWFIFKNIDNKKKPYNYLFYYLCLNFLTDYTYAINGLFLLWFLLIGLIIKKEKEKTFKLYPLFSFFTLFLVFLKLTGKIFTLSGLPEVGIIFNPYDHQTFQNLIDKTKNQGNLPQAIKLAKDYQKKSFLGFESLSFLGDFYLNLGKKKESLSFYQRITDNNRFPSLEVLRKVYFLKKEVEGKERADEYFDKFFKNFKTSFWLSKSFEDKVYQFCFQEEIVSCRFRYFYTPKPKTIEKSDTNLPIKAIYTFNNEGFNERFDYSVKKPKDTFRILVLGDANAFGFLVNTKDNWVERLENKFKVQSSKFKVEVINLSYHSYDLAYAIERFRRQGIKYQPDLIIFMNNNYYRINEIFLPLTEKYTYLDNNPQEKERFRKEGKYFPSWDLAWEEYLKKVKEDEVYQRQKDYLKEFFSLYKGKVLFISFYEIPKEIKDFIKNYSEAKVIELLNFPKNKNFYYKEIPSVINPKGHEKLAEEILDFLRENFLIQLLRNIFPQ